MPGLSVIIPALNEEVEIADAVHSAHRAGAAEVLVIDGGSQDGTASQAEAAGARVVRGPRGRGRQIALGVSPERLARSYRVSGSPWGLL